VEFDADRAEVLQRARDAGVSGILNVGTGDPHSGALKRAAELTKTGENLWAAVGVHPHDAKLYDDAAEVKIRELITANPKVVAWGEIGLDFHYDNSPRDVQLQVFRRQLRSARELRVPVIIHTREAEQETVELLRTEWQSNGLPGVMHCFSGSAELAQQAVEMGLSISFSGIVTFKKADELRAVAQGIPQDRLLIETDCPYLTPVPFRGKRNEPSYVVEVAKCLADLRGVEAEEIGRVTNENFFRIFNVSVD
jgi:TatD DNase family protein